MYTAIDWGYKMFPISNKNFTKKYKHASQRVPHAVRPSTHTPHPAGATNRSRISENHKVRHPKEKMVFDNANQD